MYFVLPKYEYYEKNASSTIYISMDVLLDIAVICQIQTETIYLWIKYKYSFIHIEFLRRITYTYMRIAKDKFVKIPYDSVPHRRCKLYYRHYSIVTSM